MELWRIKSASLRLMFADSDMNFSLSEFNDGILESNPNTRDKLIGMDDSIRRAINTYYNFVNQDVISDIFELVPDGDDYFNKIDLSDLSGGYIPVEFPTRIDVLFYDISGEEPYLLREEQQIDFSFENISKKVYFTSRNFSGFGDNVKFRIFYKIKKLNLPYGATLEYDLSTIYIPEEVQSMIPYFVKGELYEEDEPNAALFARNEYMRFLTGLRRPFHNAQTKVKRARVFDK
jgi:hypothetical protein